METSEVEFRNSLDTLWCIIAPPQEKFKNLQFLAGLKVVSVFSSTILNKKACNNYIIEWKRNKTQINKVKGRIQHRRCWKIFATGRGCEWKFFAREGPASSNFKTETSVEKHCLQPSLQHFPNTTLGQILTPFPSIFLLPFHDDGNSLNIEL